MAKFKMNNMVESASGKVGKMVFKQVGSRTLFTCAPEVSGITSPKQQLQRDRFKRAAEYAKNTMLDPTARAAYKKSVEGEEFKNGFTAAVTDYLLNPRLDFMDTTGYTGAVGETILLKVYDTFKVTGVKVTIMLPDNSILETGVAVLSPNSVDWLYVTTAANGSLAGSKVKVDVIDTANNTTTQITTL